MRKKFNQFRMWLYNTMAYDAKSWDWFMIGVITIATICILFVSGLLIWAGMSLLQGIISAVGADPRARCTNI